MIDVNSARRQMIEQQVRAWDVLDLAVLKAMERVPREEFAPPAVSRPRLRRHERAARARAAHACRRSSRAGSCRPSRSNPAIECSRSAPAAGISPRASERSPRTVHSVEIHADLADAARASLLRTRALNVTVETADAFTRTDAAVYDVIALTGALPVYDPRFERMLAEGGRLFVVVGERPVMEARRITRTGPDDWLREGLFETVIEPLIHAAEPSRFVF